MLSNFFPALTGLFMILAYVLSFGLTVLLIATLKNKMPHDGGRAFAVNGQLSKGKPRGIGLIIVSVVILCFILFLPLSNAEFPIYCMCIFLEMMSGFLDDASETPWSDYKKGAIDLFVSLVLAFTYSYYNGSEVHLLLFKTSFELPKWLFIILAVILVWVAINVVNCTDGVDGLCGSLSVVSFIGFLLVLIQARSTTAMNPLTVIFTMSMLAYLLFNASPSHVLMGDAGSRAIGLMLALLSLYSDPFLFLLLCLVFIIDGGLGLVKIFLLRFLKIRILKKTRTPLHDHYRKEIGWSDTQTVFRFVIIQTVLVILVLSIISL